MDQHRSGSCRCAAVRVELQLPCPLTRITPRRCDCDYCTAHDGIYLSHPRGRLDIYAAHPLRTERQGSGLARMLHCADCGDLIAVTCEIDGRLRGALRAAILDDAALLPAAETVSPKRLRPDEKLDRWRSVWLHVAHNVDRRET